MLSFSLGNNKKPLLGIDIGNTSVKVVEVQAGKDRAELLSYASLDLPESATEDGAVADPVAVAEVLQKAVASMGAKTKNCAMAVTGASVITKTILVSSELNDAQLEVEIELEADQHIPFPLDDVALDFMVLGPSEKADDSNDVLLVACRREAIEVLHDISDSCELKPKVIDFKPYAQLRVLSALMKAEGMEPNAVVALVELGATNFDIKVAHDNEIVYTREQLFGSQELVQNIADRFDISLQEAKRQLSRHELLPAEAEAELIAPFRAQVLQQITRSLQLFFAATNYNDVDAIVISGDAAGLPKLLDLLKEDLGTAVFMASPESFLNCDKVKDKSGLRREGSSLMLACGLAIWGDTRYE